MRINYEEFKRLFIREDGKRKNRVLLDMWLDKAFNEYIKSNPQYSSLLRAKSMADIYYLCDLFVSRTRTGAHLHRIFDRHYASNEFASDGGGICVDGDFRGYRYYNVERQAIFKMKIGKMYKHLILSSEFGKHLPESIILYMCEEMTTKWMAYTQSKCKGYELHVDDDFARIYDSDECVGDFHSCMTDGNNYHFYEDAVDAKAAYLTNSEDKIVARCVIYTKAVDSDGKVWRLAERQYSSDCDDIYKRLLVQALINGGHIDAYKKVGAGCHDPRLWMDVNDNAVANPKFCIDCRLDCGDTMSYQDSFKWFDFNGQKAYNYGDCGFGELLSSTDDTFAGGNWDSWHEEYTSERLINVYYRGERYTCDEDRLDDFRWVESRGEYHHENDVAYCEWCNNYELFDDCFYSELTNERYCSDNCLDEAEEDYKRDNWVWSDFHNEYIEPDDAVTYHHDGTDDVVSMAYADRLVRDGEAVERNGEYYKIDE
jgi:hypothetical protein